MYLVTFAIRRDISPEKGQEMVKQLTEKVSNKVNPLAMGQGKVMIEGISTHENPFPEWLVEQLKANIENLEHDVFNFQYKAKAATEADAQAMYQWVQAGLKPWIKSSSPNPAIADGLHVTIMADVDLPDLAGLDEF